MTTVARSISNRHYGLQYETDAVGADSVHVSRATSSIFSPDSSVTTGHDKASLFHSVVEARAAAEVQNWDHEGGAPIHAGTVNQAIQLAFALPGFLPPPTIAPESTGEITFEWYRDSKNIAVLSVDGQLIRWSSIHNGQPAEPGSAPFVKSIPSAALQAVSKVLERTS